MLFPRCTSTHRRLCYPLLRELHTTNAYLQAFGSIFQLEPTTAEASVYSKSPIPVPSQFRSNGRKKWKKLRRVHEDKGSTLGNLSHSTPTKLSALLRLRIKHAQPTRVEGGRRRFPLNPSTTQEVVQALLDSNEESAQSIFNDDGPNVRGIQSPSLYSRRVEGIIRPRASGAPLLEDVMSLSPQSPIATLSHGLERVLFTPGVQWLQDPRSRVYSFTTWLEQIIPVKNFAFERLQPFVPSSRDEDLFAVAQREGRKYAGSTSSMSGLLSHLYYLISGDKPVNTSTLSNSFETQPRTFVPSQRVPTTVTLHYRDGVYLIDRAGDPIPGLSHKNVLVWMGTLLEKFLTRTPREFLGLTRSVPDPAVVANEPKREAYRYAKSDKFILRSQLDCFDHRLPGTGVFDIKTRAVMTIRHDLLNFKESAGYQIRTLQGPVGSFEKEYYDLIRSAFLKYSFQARIGNMDGVFVAYHNTERIFGFQYVPLSEMDARLFGEHAAGDAVFEKCVLLLEAILDEATSELPCQSIRLTAEKVRGKDSLRVFVEPAVHDKQLQGPIPVIQLDVSAESYIYEKATSGSNAVKRSKLPWTIHWSVSKSALDPDTIRTKLTALRKRSFFPYFLPTRVGIRKMERVWHSLQFNPVAPVKVPFKAKLFRRAPKSVQVLRRLSRNGRGYLQRTMHKQEGRPKLVLGLPNDAQEVAPLVALARGNSSVQGIDRRPGDKEASDDKTATSEQPNLITEQTTRIRATPTLSDIPFSLEADTSGGDGIVPGGTHLEEMLSEDQRTAAENRNSFSA